jgi:hypothetical protein
LWKLERWIARRGKEEKAVGRKQMAVSRKQESAGNKLIKKRGQERTALFMVAGLIQRTV